MGIRGSLWEFKRSYKTQYSWPKLNLSCSGPKLKIDDLERLPFDISDEHAAFLLWKNGGEPENTWYTRKGQSLQIRWFYGIGSEHDLRDAILEHRDILPRFSVPVARVESYDHDVSLLLTFPFDGRKGFREPTKGREKKIWFHWIFEDNLPEDSKLDDVVLAAHSLTALTNALKPEPPNKYKRFDGCDDSGDDEDFD